MFKHFKIVHTLIVYFSITSCITSCSYLNTRPTLLVNHDKDYLTASSIAPLKIPPGLSSSTMAAHYPVTDTYAAPHSTEVSLLPPGLESATPTTKSPVIRKKSVAVKPLPTPASTYLDRNLRSTGKKLSGQETPETTNQQ